MCYVCAGQKRFREVLSSREIPKSPRPVSPYSVYWVRRSSGIRYYYCSKSDLTVESRSKSLPPRLSSEPTFAATQFLSPRRRRKVSRARARQVSHDNKWVEIGGSRPRPKLSTKKNRYTIRTTNENQKRNSSTDSYDQQNSKKNPTTLQRKKQEQLPRKETFEEQDTWPIEEHEFNNYLRNIERSATVGHVYEDQESSRRKCLRDTDRLMSSCHRRQLSLGRVEPILTLYETLRRLRLLSRFKANAEYWSERLRVFRQNIACIAAAVPISSTEHDELFWSPPSPAPASLETD